MQYIEQNFHKKLLKIKKWRTVTLKKTLKKLILKSHRGREAILARAGPPEGQIPEKGVKIPSNCCPVSQKSSQN